jgi:hypothetical protein
VPAPASPLAELPAPAPSPALAQAIAEARPVRTRRPRRALAAVAGGALAGAAALLAVVGVRRDLAGVPAVALALYGLLCLAAFSAQLLVALVPRRGQVLPASGLAARLSLLAMIVLAPLSVYVGAGLASGTVEPSRWWSSTARCAAIALLVAAVPVGLSLVALRRLLPLGAWRSTAGVAAAGGALAALVLELHCTLAELGHVALGHAVAIALPALALAAVALARR